MKRLVFRRTIGATGSEIAGPAEIDLRQVAWAAAVETMQINLVARGWVGLFGAMLDPISTSLVWRGNGPGGEAEIKRAYSALMGRFFGRAVLRSEHRIKWLQQASEGLEVKPGIRVLRKGGPQHAGDLPDWVGWDRDRKMWAVCEAKGSYGSTRWMNGEPEPVSTGLRQISRIEFRDAAGPIASEGWVVANRWGTVDNGKPPVILTVDPRNDGRLLSPGEARRAEGELRVSWFAGLLSAIGQNSVALRLISGAAATADDDRGLVRVGDRVGYATLAIDGAGLFPMAGEEREDLRRALLRFARDRDRKVALIVIDRDCVEVARSREIDDDEGATKTEPSELTTRGEALGEQTSAGSDDTSAITQDGVTLTWTVDQLDFKAL